MEYLYVRKFFITEKLYTTSDIVTSDFSELLKNLKERVSSNTIDILCDEIPINEILELFKSYDIKQIQTNASFKFHPLPTDMIPPNTLYLCIGRFTDNTQRIHQIAFIKDNTYYRFGVSIWKYHKIC